MTTIVRTDHKPLIFKLSKSTTIPPLLPRHSRWIEKLSPFSLVYEHVSGEENQIADALSRTPQFYINAVSLNQEHHYEMIAMDDVRRAGLPGREVPGTTKTYHD